MGGGEEKGGWGKEKGRWGRGEGWRKKTREDEWLIHCNRHLKSFLVCDD